MVIEPFQSRYAKYWVEDNILYCRILNSLSVTLPVAKQLVKDRLAFSQGTSFIALFDIRNISETSLAARDYMASEEANKELIAAALLTNETVSRVIGEVFVNKHRPYIPTRVFTDMTEALHWIESYRMPYINS